MVRGGLSEADPAGGGLQYSRGMCRNIKVLFNFQPPATDEEVAAAALQYVRKDQRHASRANQEALQ
jgi:hypothetical protein